MTGTGGELLVLWDIDYTLVNSGGLGADLYQVVFSQMFGRPLPELAPMAGRTDRAIILATLARASVPRPEEHVDAFIALLGKHAAASGDVARARARALPGAANALAALSARAALDATARPGGVRQSVLTGNIRPLAEAKLGAAGLLAHLDLDAGAYGDAHEVRAELVGLARQRARAAYGSAFDGAATVLVGDTPLDVAAALTAGARAVAVATGAYPAADLAAAGAHAVLPDLTDTCLLLSAVHDGGQLPVCVISGVRPSAACGPSRPRQQR
ncbi:MAG: haloacid dehalogenase-like hydrolase [Streptosporangiaceae bacterium]|nr:haloacid dehalogenase-like hydrolase [Streptosporangiaceae bacterium]MBV9854753.1 haloacid dehalogenase-like hydrolase [Streptosporangiaceae bacterium]